MKIRQGFVSNSSSSSFIAVGIRIKKGSVTDELWDLANEHGYSVFNDEEDGYTSDEFAVIGNIIADADDSDTMEEKTVTTDEIIEKGRKISKDMGELGEFVVISGTRLC